MAKEEALEFKGDEDDDEGIISLDSLFFVDRNYELTEFTFGSNSLQLLCLRTASTDYDLTGQLVWPGAVLMNNYLSSHAQILSDRSVIELGSGVGLTTEKLEWGNREHIEQILQKHPSGFDLVLGADIYILFKMFSHEFVT